MPYAANLEKLALPNVAEVVEAVESRHVSLSRGEGTDADQHHHAGPSPTMEEGNLAKWLVKEGDKVKSGDVIAEIETDKATMEVEAVDEGTVAKIVVPAGTEGVKVNALIAVLAGEGEDAEDAAASGGGAPAKAAAPQAAEAPQAEPQPAAAQPQRQRLRRRPGAEQPQRRRRPTASGGGRTFASPLARRIAKDAGIDLAAVQGSGPHGRVVKARRRGGDRRRRRQGRAARPAPAPRRRLRPPQRRCRTMQVLKLFEQGSYELVPHDNMRKTIARRLVEAKQTIPHFYLTIDCELDALLALRAQLNAAAPEGQGRQARPTSSRSTTWSSRRWRWRCATCRTPTSPGPKAPWSSTSTPMSASPCRSPAA